MREPIKTTPEELAELLALCHENIRIADMTDARYRDGEVNADDEDSGGQSLYATVTIILQDRAQALRLAECENTSLHAVFVTRGDEKLKAECLKAQLKLLTGEISTTEADGTSDPAGIPEPTAESEESNG